MSKPTLISLAAQLRDAVDQLTFTDPVAYTYNPLRYAWEPHQIYLERYGRAPKRVVFLGMNPGPFGMAQIGVPFGEVKLVREWLCIEAPVHKPAREHPKRPVTGFACTRSEVSGRRLWGLFADRFGTAEKFFQDHIVINYCPLVWMSESGANLTPDKLRAAERAAIDIPCQAHLRGALKLLRPSHVVGIGQFAAKQLAAATETEDPWTVSSVLHPSPASPLANRGWAEAATKSLIENGIWT